MSQRRKLRVCHFLPGREFAGVQRYVINLVSELEKLDVETYAFVECESLENRLHEASHAKTQLVPLQGYLDLYGLAQICKTIRAWDVDILHAHLGLDSFALAAAASLTGKPLVLSVHLVEPNYWYKPWPIKTIWRIVQLVKNTRVSAFLPISSAVATRLVERENADEARVITVNPGTEIFEPQPGDREFWRGKLGLSDSSKLVLSVGRLQPEKGMDLFVEAALSLHGRWPEAVFAIAGSGTEESRLLVLKGQSESIRLLGHVDDIHALLAAADIFVLASRQEGFGLAAVEAMSARLPVVATNVAGLATIVEPGITGLLVSSEDKGALAGAISQLLADEAQAVAFGRAGRQRAEQLFAVTPMAAKVLSVYRRLVVDK